MKRQEVKIEPVDVTNDAMMVAAGLRQPMRVPRDPSVWSKTAKERSKWQEHRRFPTPSGQWSAPEKSGGLPGVLVVSVRGCEKTTYSHKCNTSDVKHLLSRYKSMTSSVVKCSWNGKTIDPENILLRGA